MSVHGACGVARPWTGQIQFAKDASVPRVAKEEQPTAEHKGNDDGELEGHAPESSC